MADFKMKIAGQTAAVRSLYGSTPEYFRPYLTEEPADFSITITPEDVRFEREKTTEEALEEGFRIRNFPDTYLERASIQRKFAEYLFDFDTLLFHGSTVAVDGAAYLFTANSGTGKSTHTRLWRQVLGERAVMVNDDKPFLRFTQEHILACGSPWSGKHGLDANIAVPLKGICILQRGAENRIRSLSASEAMSMLRKQSYRPLDCRKSEAFAVLVDKLAARIPLWQMECTKDPQAAMVSYSAMSAVK